MTKIRIASDLHREFGFEACWNFPELNDDKDTVLILSGDIGLAKSPLTFAGTGSSFDYKRGADPYEPIDARTWLECLCDQFKEVVFIMGNHEHYGTSFLRTKIKMDAIFSAFAPGRNNIRVLEKDFLLVDNLAIIGATLWTNMDNLNQMTMYDANMYMNDYKTIRMGPSENDAHKRKLTPNDTISDHFRATEYIYDAIKFHRAEGRKVVVATHMAPSKQSIHPMYKGESLNGAYCSPLDDDIITLQPDLWIHGHVHNTFDYMIGNTRVVCNPQGYISQFNHDFDRELVIEI